MICSHAARLGVDSGSDHPWLYDCNEQYIQYYKWVKWAIANRRKFFPRRKRKKKKNPRAPSATFINGVTASLRTGDYRKENRNKPVVNISFETSLEIYFPTGLLPAHLNFRGFVFFPKSGDSRFEDFLIIDISRSLVLMLVLDAIVLHLMLSWDISSYREIQHGI